MIFKTFIDIGILSGLPNSKNIDEERTLNAIINKTEEYFCKKFILKKFFTYMRLPLA